MDLCTGGHYLPSLAMEILAGNERAAAAAAAAAAAPPAPARTPPAASPGHGYINLQGFLVGNAWTDAAVDNLGAHAGGEYCPLMLPSC
jgi:serine carboxypeptidase-like clade II